MKRDSKVILAMTVIFSTVNFIDFFFYGQKIGYLVLALGFLLIAFGTYRDNNNASFFGAVLVIYGFTAKWFLDYDLF
jgi:hypothetical protein